MPLKELIDNPHSERVKRIAALTRGKVNDLHKFLVEGPQSVREAVRYAADSICDIYVAENVVNDYKSFTNNHSSDSNENNSTDTIRAIVEESLEKGCYVHPVSLEVIRKISSDSQGIVAVLNSKSLDDFYTSSFYNLQNSLVKKSLDENPLDENHIKPLRIAACWQVRDPGNAGAIIRVADVAGCDAVVFVDDCVSRWNSKLIRSTAGSLFHLPVVSISENEWFDWAKKLGIRIIAADIYGTDERKPKDFPIILDDNNIMESSLAVLFGNEARGLPVSVLNKVDEISVIPIYGKAESMNLATSAAVMLMGLAMSSHARKM
ncbi:TrmH family RNA methyltransferase [Gardnerella vaginalis]|uniref:RNA methyltransferase n=1 Tax=Gardnerella vaginalis TaxID=2702 RepID=A0A2K1SW54_GARVA|nr:RNA methyltransferase [Gardnerella vaginalis]PNS43746.1 RNA methyltransferase [Gardnerella vaginalis]